MTGRHRPARSSTHHPRRHRSVPSVIDAPSLNLYLTWGRSWSCTSTELPTGHIASRTTLRMHATPSVSQVTCLTHVTRHRHSHLPSHWSHNTSDASSPHSHIPSQQSRHKRHATLHADLLLLDLFTSHPQNHNMLASPHTPHGCLGASGPASTPSFTPQRTTPGTAGATAAALLLLLRGESSRERMDLLPLRRIGSDEG